MKHVEKVQYFVNMPFHPQKGGTKQRPNGVRLLQVAQRLRHCYFQVNWLMDTAQLNNKCFLLFQLKSNIPITTSFKIYTFLI